jgi:hypothetical protein
LYEEFFVVCSLFEFALRPRMELQLKCDPHVPELQKLDDLNKMTKVENPKELEEIKEYFGELQPRKQEAQLSQEEIDHQNQLEEEQQRVNLSAEVVYDKERKRIDKFMEKKLKLQGQDGNQGEL